MRASFAYGLKEIAAAVVLSSFIAGGVGAMTGPSALDLASDAALSVNRTHKADRLPVRSQRQPNPSSSTMMAPAAPRQPPLGCDRAFSPVVDPAMAHVFKRCMV